MKTSQFLANRLSLFFGVLFVISIATLSAFGQTGTSSVRGTVSDPQGNVVRGAAVTIINTETNTTRTVNTSDGGIYVFELLPPGPYRVEVEAQGFKKGVVTDVQALVAKATEVNVQLEVGAVSETVTVAASANEVLLNTQDATLGNNFQSKQIAQLPLEARNVASLLTLQAGVTREGSVTGSRADQANVTLDGVDINEQQTNQIGSVSNSDATSLSPGTNTVLRLNAEAIDEFRVVTANPNAQFGRSSGAQVSLITKGGSNDFHGALFWFHRPTVLTANNFFNNRAGNFGPNDIQVQLGIAKAGDEKVPRPALIRNTFGGAFGGPIVRDRAFFFYSYEGRTDRSAQTVLQRVPLPTMGQGELRFANNSGGVTTVTAANIATIFPGLNGTNPAALAALADAARRYPANDFGNTGDSFVNSAGQLVRLNTAGYRFNAYLPSNFNSHTAKFDFNLTSKQQLFLRANVNHDQIAGTPAFPDTPRPDTWSHPWGVAAGHTWTMGSRFVNNFRYGLTREAFTTQGDAAKNEIYFRFVFFPVLDSRTLHRTTPVHNFTNDFSWVMDNHTAQFGGNFRIVRNRRTSFSGAFDTAYTNPSGYVSGAALSTSVRNFFPVGNPLRPPTSQNSVIQNAVAALLGRLTSWSARLTYDKEGKLLPSGTPTEREFATEEYEVYGQDTWKIRPSLTLTYGLRYSLSRPIYETSGYETKPNIPLGEYFRRRVAAAEQGKNYFEPLLMELSGPANGKTHMYPWDKNNFQPRVGIAWSPNFKGFLGKMFGESGKSVFRGGFAMTNDFLGQQLATRFDQLNSLGFASSINSPFSYCNLTTNRCPLFTSYSQSVRTFELVAPAISNTLTFPRQRPADMALVIETSLDEEIVAPTNYMWNLTYERELPKGLVVQASYIGRLGRNLLLSRDVMMPNNLRDPKSGVDWYTAAGILEDLRRADTPVNQVASIPFFDNFFGTVPNFSENLTGVSGLTPTQAVYYLAYNFYGNDWTTVQSDIDIWGLRFEGLPLVFYQPQYGALSSFSTLGNSEYHGGTLSLRQRIGDSLTMDFNYTLSKSMDDASGLQTSGSYGGAFILNPLRQSDSWAVSDFDVRHIINFNAVWQLPVGRNRMFSFGGNKWANGVLGDWQLSSIMRWNSGYPISAPYDAATWATNWNVQSFGTRTRPVQACPTRGGTQPPRLFGCDPTAAYQSFRNARPGETGDRNVFRLPGYFVLDMGLAKTLNMPWGENHKLQLRFEAFNVTNTQRMGAVLSTRDGYGLVVDPHTTPAPTNFSNFTAIQGDRRTMQFGFRYSF